MYELTAGLLDAEGSPNRTLKFPAYYLTNITSNLNLTAEEVMANVTLLSIHDDFLNKEPFTGGVVAISFVLAGIVTAGWMFFLLLLLSSNSIPNSLILTNAVFCAGHTAMLSKLTEISQNQVMHNFADTTMIHYLITFSTKYIVVRNITSLLIWISWLDLLVQMNKWSRRNYILLGGLCLSLISFAFAIAYNFLYQRQETSNHLLGVKVMHYFMEYLLITIFAIQVVHYTFKKKKFAYHKRAMALAIFALGTLLTPYAFTTINLVSGPLGSWATYVAIFTKLCCTMVTWEWLHTIRSLELKYEKKAVLGRRISNENFAQITGTDPGDNRPHGNTYILRSLNIVRLLSSLNPMRWTSTFKPDNGTGPQQTQDVERISLQYMGDEISPSQSNLSDNTGISIVAENPRFDVDHRYLRNTPSTLHSRTTPVSYTNATPDITEGVRYTHTPNITEDSGNDHTNDNSRT